MWFAPHVEKPPNDSIPPDALREALRGVWAGMAANRFLQHTADLSNNPHASIQLIADLAPVVVPLWEEAAVKLGLPRSMEGIGRLQLAACCAREPDIAELASVTVCGIASAESPLATDAKVSATFRCPLKGAE